MGDRRAASVLLALCLAACPSKQPSQQVASGPVVARLAAGSGAVSHRKAATLAWTSAASGLKLFHRDAIRTGAGSTARVRFTVGNQLDVDELSLVVIEAPEPPPRTPSSQPAVAPQVARVEQGSVRGVSMPGAPAVKVVTATGQVAHIKAEGNEAVPFRVRVKPDGRLEVAVLKGTARVEPSGGEAVTVKPQQVVDVTATKVSAPVELPPFPQLASPAVDEKFHAGSRVLLEWNRVPQAAIYRVQVSDAVSFARRIVDATVATPELSLPGPKPGLTYVWRVASLDAFGHESEFGFARRFVVLTAKPPPGEGLLTPPDNAGIQYTAAPRPLAFTWRSGASLFELVVARDPRLKSGVVIRKRVQGSTVTVPNLAAGEYHWGVFAVSDGSKRPIFDKARRLLIARRLPPGVRVPSSIKW